MLAGWEQRVEQQTSLTMELSRRMEHTRASAESRGGEVSVIIDSSGGLAELFLTDRAMRLTADELAALILDTSRRAQAKLAQQMVEVVGDLYGDNSETAAFIGGVYTEKFPEQPEHDEERDRR
jgi:DNA-binding protein YbaB